MVTDKQLQANTRNAQLGGVKTAEGKAVSRFNARKHAVLSNTITDYDEGLDYQSFIDDLIDEYGTPSGIKGLLIERTALTYIKLYRLQKAEQEYIKGVLKPSFVELDLSWGANKEDGYSPLMTTDGIEKLLTIYSRYETTLENRLFRLLQALESRRTGVKRVEGA